MQCGVTRKATLIEHNFWGLVRRSYFDYLLVAWMWLPKVFTEATLSVFNGLHMSPFGGEINSVVRSIRGRRGLLMAWW